MDLRELVTFQTVAQTLNFTRAADALGYAQSSVTAQIQSLEADLGVQLFNRLGRRISLTEAGIRLLAYAQRITNLCHEAREAVSSDVTMSGTITISAPESVCTYRLPVILHAFKAEWPTIRIVFQPMPLTSIYDALRDGTIDLALLLESQNAPYGLQTAVLTSETICLLAAPGHPLTTVQSLTQEHLQRENFLLTERGCVYRADFEQALSTFGVRSPTTLEFASIEAIKQCAMAGLGLAYLPQMTVVDVLASGRLVILPWPLAHLRLQMAWHREKWMSPAMHALIQTCYAVYGAADGGAAA